MSSARDVLFIAVMVFMLAVGGLIIAFSNNTISDSMANNTVINSSQPAKQAFVDMKKITNKLDYAILAVYIGMILAFIITGYFIGGHPIFVVFYFIVTAIGILISAGLSNGWETMSTATAFGNTVAQFPITNQLMLNLPIYTAITGFIGVIVMFAKGYTQGGQL